jgi:hypothetical protein
LFKKSILLIILLLTSCGGLSILKKSELANGYNYNFETETKKNSKYGGAIISDKTETQMLWDQKRFYLFSNERYTHYINDKAEKYTHFKMSINRKYWKFNKIKAATILSNGDVIEVSDDNIKTTTITNDDGDEVETI